MSGTNGAGQDFNITGGARRHRAMGIFTSVKLWWKKKKIESKIANKFLISIALWNVERHKKT